MSAVTQEDLWDDLKTLDLDGITSKYGSVMAALSHALRGAIVARAGHQLYVADFAGIEARVLLWCAGDERGLDLFRNHVDPYCDMAESIFNRPVTKADKLERGIGKIAILGLGYQMGAGAFTGLCEVAKSPIPEDCYCEHCGKGTKGHRKENHRFQFEDGQDEDTITGVKVVDAYREKYYLVKRMWEEQEASAIAAIQTRSPVDCGPVRWALEGKFLYCYLPSGRRLAYYEPQVKSTMMPWGKMKDVLSHMGVNPKTRQWQRLTVYGGLLTENIVQAIARDLLACGMHRAEATGVYSVVLTVHDEIIAESPIGRGSVKEFEDIMSDLPDWAEGCPVDTEGFSGSRYRK